jgi:formate/nitrite transporter
MKIPLGIDALLPPEMAAKAERIGAEKAQTGAVRLLALAVLAGAFIGLGAMASIVAAAGAEATMPYGLARIVAGAAFSLGLILVVIGGAELFTGDNLMVMAWSSGHIGSRRLVRAWVLIYAGNFAGAAATAVLVFLSDQHMLGQGSVGLAALTTAHAKAGLDFLPALVRGILSNVLVCLAVWLCYSARSTADRILCIVPPITAFVAAGFEHSVANMYLLPLGLLIKYFGADRFWQLIGGSSADYPSLTIGALIDNLVPVTIGNMIGGGVLVGAVYWFVYLRR